MFRKSVFLPLPRLCMYLGLLLCIASSGLTACANPTSCEACGPAPGYNPDAIPLVDANGILYSIVHTTLYALQDRSGKRLWQYTNPSLGYDAPVVSGGVVYLDMDVSDISNSSHMGEWVYALSGSTGQVLWHTRISTYPQQFSAPKLEVRDGMVYTEESRAPYNQTFFALRASDGKILWSESPRGSSDESVTLLLATAGIAYIDSYASDVGYLLARRARDGALLWRASFPLCYIGAAPPVNKTLYITAFCRNNKAETDAFQAATGKLLWHFSMPDGLITLTPTHTVVYVENSANPSPGTDRFFALDANTGELLWKREVPQRSVGADTHIWTANDDAAYTTINGVWSILGARDGKPLWDIPSTDQFGVNSSVLLHLNMQSWLLSRTLVYVPGAHQVDAFQARTGKLHWDFGLPTGESMSSILLFQGTMYLSGRIQDQQAVQPTSQKQDTYALQAGTGKVLWHTIQTQPPQVMTHDNVYFSMVTGKPYHYTYSILALQSSSGKRMWTFQA